ncbi:FAD-dependent urate hydroxylase HpxO [Halotalea alkalilenta]|uniref:FAD-dependent urate hydroxylase n=1 Tax=Halotalea alkalilenta TaxID=376489 RepID=A0A172YAI3_9GAMM|nr:FAD-dependent urate hydroxylase HpxO [Halotalea alkalilenta]ANF56230.1 monooxygenase [Halotalea alkalilenta]
MKTLDIVIAGAGMGGLTAAIALKRQGHRVRLFDRAPELAPAGSAISVWSNGVKVLGALGLNDAIDAASGTMSTMSYSDRDGRLLTRFSLEPLYDQVRQSAKPIARTELQRVLLDAVGAEHVTLGVSCARYQLEGERVAVFFDDGQRIEADLLIAADGTHSKLRDLVAGRAIERRYCGYVNWNGRVTASDDLAQADEWAQFVGEGKRVSLMPMGGDQFYFFFDVPLAKGSVNDRDLYRDELSEHFAGWAAPVQRLIERLDPATVARVEIHDIEPLERLVDQRVALLGDAAHAMAPDLGQGGCQAMEDAWVLAECLAAAGEDVPAALEAYDRARVERVASIVERARKRCDITHGKQPEETQAWYAELLEESGDRVIQGMRKTILGGPLG